MLTPLVAISISKYIPRIATLTTKACAAAVTSVAHHTLPNPQSSSRQHTSALQPIIQFHSAFFSTQTKLSTNPINPPKPVFTKEQIDKLAAFEKK